MELAEQLNTLNESDLNEALEAIRDDLECAEQAENEKDFTVNIDEAITNAVILLGKLRQLRSETD